MPKKKIPLLQAYQKAFNNPLRISKRQIQQLQEAMSSLTKLGDASTGENFTDTNPDYQGPMTKGAGPGTKDRMPGTSPNEKRTKSGKSTNSQYIPTPLDNRGNRKGYI